MAINYHKVLDLLATVGLNAGIGAGFGGLLGMLPSSYAVTKEEKRKRLLSLIATGGTIGGIRGTFAYFRPDPNEKKTYKLPEAEDSTSPQQPSQGPKKTNEPVYGPVDIVNAIKGTGALKLASVEQARALYKNAVDFSLANSIPASHYDSRVPENITRARLGLRQGSDQAFWRNYYAGMAAKDTPTRNYHNMLANAANTPGDHQRYYVNGKEPPWEALKKFAPGLANNTLYKFIPKMTLDDLRPKK